MVVPTLSKFLRAVVKSVVSVQVEPLKLSTRAWSPPGEYPPTAKHAVVDPSPAKYPLAVFKSPDSVHADPFHNSVKPDAGCAPKYIPAVVVPPSSELSLP